MAKALIRQKDVSNEVMVAFGTKPGFVSFIDKSGTEGFRDLPDCMLTNSNWQDIMAEVGKRVSQKKIPYKRYKNKNKLVYAKQEPVYYDNCQEKIPLEDQGKIFFRKVVL